MVIVEIMIIILFCIGLLSASYLLCTVFFNKKSQNEYFRYFIIFIGFLFGSFITKDLIIDGRQVKIVEKYNIYSIDNNTLFIDKNVLFILKNI